MPLYFKCFKSSRIYVEEFWLKTVRNNFENVLILNLGPDRLESIILKIIGKKIYNPPCHLQSIIPENYRFFAYYSGK